MKKNVVQILAKLIDLPTWQIKQIMERPPSREQGDLAFPCFHLAKTFKQAPAQIAANLVEKLKIELDQLDFIEDVKSVGPYINFFYQRQQVAKNLLSQSLKDYLSEQQIGHGKTVIVEYSSPNIAKDFKLYHIRSTMIGQALANTYAALGYKVERINHLGDWGTQFGKLMAAYLKWGSEEQIKQDPITELVKLYVRFHEEAESQPELEDEGRLWFKKLEEGDEEALRLWEWFKEESLNEFNKIYKLLNVQFDHFLGESFYSDKMDAALSMMKDKNILEESEGALIVRLDEDNIPPCIIQKSDGTSIYATRDIAAAIYRYETFKPEKLLYVVDQRQALHFQQVFAVLKKMGFQFADKCEHLPFGIMKIEGEIGSTRKGKGLLLEDVLEYAIEKARGIIEEKNPELENKEAVAEAVGLGAIVFNDLKHHRTHEIDFKWEEAFNFEGKTGPYVQYTHARIQSLLKRANQSRLEPVLHSIYEQDLVWELIYLIQLYPHFLLETTKKNDPSQIAKFLLDICQLFNRFYAQDRIFVEDEVEQKAKLALCFKVAEVLKHGLSMLTIKAPDAI